MLQLYGNTRSRAMRCLWMLEEMGLSTGIDLAKLLACRAILKDGLPNEKLSGHLAEVGLARTQSGGRVASAQRHGK